MGIPRYDARKTVAWAATGGAELAYRAFNIDLDVNETEMIRNGVYVGGYQDEAAYPGSSRARCAFSCELEGGTAADAAPAHDPLINACGFDVDTVGGISTWHLGDTHATGGEIVAADIKINLDGLQSAIENAVGNVLFTFEAGKFAIMDFNFIGLVPTGFAGATEVALPSLTAQSTPVPCENMSLSLGPDGAAVGGLVCAKVVLDPGNALTRRPDLNGVNGESAPIVPKRDPTYNFLIEATAIATLNLESLFLSRSIVDFEFTHNAAGGTNQVCDVSGSGYIKEFPKKIVVGNTIYYNLFLTQLAATDLLTLTWS